MGYGDQVMGAGMARGAASRGKRIAFGDGKRILWDKWSPEVFKGNPNIAPPGSESDADVEWVHHYKGHRLYNTHDPVNGRWIWNMEFRAIPGEMFFDADELAWAEQIGSGFVVIEPNTPRQKPSARNKQWPFDRYDEVAKRLQSDGYECIQFKHDYNLVGHRIPKVRVIKATFRQALAIMARAKLFIGSEGGLHHGAAAVRCPAVVIFGGYVPPQVTGYDGHINFTGGATACGSLRPCQHCRVALFNIKVGEVVAAARRLLGS